MKVEKGSLSLVNEPLVEEKYISEGTQKGY